MAQSFFKTKPQSGKPMSIKGFADGLADMDAAMWNMEMSNGARINRDNPRRWIIPIGDTGDTGGGGGGTFDTAFPFDVDEIPYVGTSELYSRSDHGHAIPFDSFAPEPVAGSADAGSSGYVSHSDHVHLSPTTTQTVVTDVQYDTATQQIQKKTRLLTVVSGDTETAWTLITGGQAAACDDT
jgi:hypothetical protein